MKNKKLLWIMVMLILVVGSVAVEGGIVDTLKGFTSKIGSSIGKTGSFLPIIVNTIILTILIYFILNLIKFKMEGKKAPLIILTIIAVLSFIIAKNVYGDKYIWLVQGLFKNLMDIIVSPSKLGVFIGSSLMFVWLFNELKVGGEGFGAKLNMIMAALIGYNLAAQGAAPSTIVKAGEMIAIYILYNNLLKGNVKNKWVALGGASFLVFYISSVAFEGKGIIYTIPGALLSVGVIAFQVILIWSLSKLGGMGVSGLPRGIKSSKLMGGVKWIIAAIITYGIFWGLNQVEWFEKTFGMGIFAGKSWLNLLLLALGAIILFVALGKADKKEGEEEKGSRLTKTIIPYFLDPLIKWMKKNDSDTIQAINRTIDPRRKGLTDETTPLTFRDLRVELMVLMNWMLRLEVYKAKRNSMKKAEKILKEDIYSEKGLSDVYDINIITKNLDLLKNGIGYKYDASENRINAIKKGKTSIGFNCTEHIIFQLLNSMLDELDNFTHIVNKDYSDSIESKSKEVLESTYHKVQDELPRQGSTEFEKVGGHFKRRCTYNVLESIRWHVFDQKRISGKYDHSYKYARPGVTIELWKVPTPVSSSNSRFRSIEWENVTPENPNYDQVRDENHGYFEVYTREYEVDNNGFFMDDVNKAKIRGTGAYALIRKVKPKDEVPDKKNRDKKDNPDINIVNHLMLNNVITWLVTEWDMFIIDVRDGEFHQMSRTAGDYKRIHDKKSINYQNVIKGPEAVGRGNPAFDREALKDPTTIYWGREKCDDDRNDLLVLTQNENNLPGISTLGLRDYIISYLQKQTPKEDFEKHIAIYTFDTGSDKGDLITDRPHQENENAK